MDKSVINMAVNKKYSDFSSVIKTALHSKLASSPEIDAYTQEFDKIQQMKTSFAEINNSSGA